MSTRLTPHTHKRHERALKRLRSDFLLVCSSTASRPCLIDVLPNELLSEIFIYFCQSLPHSEAKFSFLPSSSTPSTKESEDIQPQAILTTICSRWRDVAYATPRLWTNITLTIQNTAPCPESFYSMFPLSMPKHIAVAAEWLGRSGVRPLSIVVRNQPSLQPAFTPSVLTPDMAGEELLSLVTAHAPQWSMLQITQHFPLDSYRKSIFSLPPTTQLSHLKTLELCFNKHSFRYGLDASGAEKVEVEKCNSEFGPESFQFLSNASKLESFTILGQAPFLDNLLQPLQTHVNQLTTLKLISLSSTSRWGPQCMREILLTFTALREVHLSIPTEEKQLASAHAPALLDRRSAIQQVMAMGVTTLPALNSLTLTTDFSEGLVHVLSKLSLPNLSMLSLSITDVLGQTDSTDSTSLNSLPTLNDTLLRLLHQSRFTLTALKLNNLDDLSTSVLEHILVSANSSLEELEVFYCNSVDLVELVESFDVGFRSRPQLDLRPVLPRLQTFYLGASFEGLRRGEGEGDADGIVDWTLGRSRVTSIDGTGPTSQLLQLHQQQIGNGNEGGSSGAGAGVTFLKQVYFQFNDSALTAEQKGIVNNFVNLNADRQGDGDGDLAEGNTKFELDFIEEVWEFDSDDEDEMDVDAGY